MNQQPVPAAAEPTVPAPAAPSAPAVPAPVPPTPAVEPAPAAEPSPKYRDLADARRSLRQGAREIADRKEAERRAAQPATSPPRDDKGRFASPAPVTGPEPASSDAGTQRETVTPAGTPPAPGAPVAAEPTPAPEAGTAPPDGQVTIELPADHPLRKDRGVTSVTVPKAAEEIVRYGINQAVRSRDVGELRKQLGEAEQWAIAAQAEAQYWKGQIQAPVAAEDLTEMEADIKRAYPGKLGELMWEGVRARLSGEDTSGVEAAREEAVRQVEMDRLKVEGERFVDYTLRDALFGVDGRPPRFPGWDRDGVIRALKIYGQFIKVEGRANVDGTEFVRDFAMPLYLRSEAGKRYGQEAARRLQQHQLDDARRQGEEKVRTQTQQQLREAAERHTTNPMSRLPVTANLSARGVTAEGEEGERRSLDIGALRRKLRTEVRTLTGGRG